MSGVPFFGGCIPARLRWWCPTYYIGIAASMVYILPLLALVVIAALTTALFEGFVAIPKEFNHDD